MSSSRFYQQWILVAACIWLCVSLFGAYGHFCLDGKEPSVSVHMGADKEAHHQPNDQHTDMDVQLSKIAPVKFFKIELPLLLAVLVILLLVVIAKLVEFLYQAPLARLFLRICPPLRAPPAPALIL